MTTEELKELFTPYCIIKYGDITEEKVPFGTENYHLPNHTDENGYPIKYWIDQNTGEIYQPYIEPELSSGQILGGSAAIIKFKDTINSVQRYYTFAPYRSNDILDEKNTAWSNLKTATQLTLPASRVYAIPYVYIQAAQTWVRGLKTKIYLDDERGWQGIEPPQILAPLVEKEGDGLRVTITDPNTLGISFDFSVTKSNDPDSTSEYKNNNINLVESDGTITETSQAIVVNYPQLKYQDGIKGTSSTKKEKQKYVKIMQERLNLYGAKPALEIDGKFGTKTLAAVKAFQKSKKLKVDGICGPKTWAALMTTPQQEEV